MDIRYSNHPNDSKKYDTIELRENYLQEKIFSKDEICLTYSHVDRIIFGGAMPVEKELILSATYFDLPGDQRIFHLMGQQNETRYVVVANEQAVISPSWSIHAGVGTSNYTFIWGMCGENQDFDDMDYIAIKDLK